MRRDLLEDIVNCHMVSQKKKRSFHAYIRTLLILSGTTDPDTPNPITNAASIPATTLICTLAFPANLPCAAEQSIEVSNSEKDWLANFRGILVDFTFCGVLAAAIECHFCDALEEGVRELTGCRCNGQKQNVNAYSKRDQTRCYLWAYGRENGSAVATVSVTHSGRTRLRSLMFPDYDK